MGSKLIRYAFPIQAGFLFLLSLVVSASAQTPVLSPSVTVEPPVGTPTLTFTGTPTPTATVTPTRTPSPSPTFNPFATATWTPTWGSPPTSTFTWTPTAGSPTAIPTSTPTTTGTWNTPTFTPTNTPEISRAGLVLLSTAHTNAYDRWDGFNWDMSFSYYIGTLLSGTDFEDGITGIERTSIAMLTSDVKYSWLDEEGDIPAIANGFLLSLLAQVGPGGGASASSGSSQGFQVSGNMMAGVYGVVSKTVAPKTAFHLGYVYGLRDLSEQSGLGLFQMNYSELLPLFTTKIPEVIGQSPPHVFYTGFNTYFWGRNWKFEIWKPFPMDQNPILFNTKVEGLPLAFNLGYERWDHGFSVLGYVNFRFTLLPTVPAY